MPRLLLAALPVLVRPSVLLGATAVASTPRPGQSWADVGRACQGARRRPR